jgi:hypothetical protein
VDHAPRDPVEWRSGDGELDSAWPRLAYRRGGGELGGAALTQGTIHAARGAAGGAERRCDQRCELLDRSPRNRSIRPLPGSRESRASARK